MTKKKKITKEGKNQKSNKQVKSCLDDNDLHKAVGGVNGSTIDMKKYGCTKRGLQHCR